MLTKREFSFVSVILLIIAAATVVNLFASYRKSRDNERKNDLGDIVNRVDTFKKTVGTYPLSDQDGNVVGCNGFQDKSRSWFFKKCEWGDNKVNSPFFDPLPHDPYVDKGRRFVYKSNGSTYLIYAALEGKYEDEYDKNIVALNISCGDIVCNAGRTNGDQKLLYSPLPEIKK